VNFKEDTPFRILALDGGGIRGLYTATLLDRLSAFFAQQTGDSSAEIGRNFDLITGTSTGGILACALAAGVPASRIVELYEESGPDIFRNPLPSSRLKRVWWAMRNSLGAANSVEPLKGALRAILGDQTMGDLWKKTGIALCIPSTKMLDETPKVFKTPHDPRFPIDQHYKVVDVCLATSAAPVFLPLAAVPDPERPRDTAVFADGGLWANNPCLVGLIEALEICSKSDNGGNRRPIEILSIGTCGLPEGNTPDLKSSRGLLDWGIGIKTTSLSMNAQAASASFMTRLLCQRISELGRPTRIVRIENPPVSLAQSKHLGMDLATPTAIQLLKQLGTRRAEDVMSLCADPASAEGRAICRTFTDNYQATTNP
jgi:patatin-like phospholipase/acyl hydrolase